MKINYRPLTMELHRTLARNPALEPANTYATLLAGAGGGSRRAESFHLQVPREAGLQIETESLERAAVRETASLFTLYCREIAQFRLLSREEESALAQRVQQGDEAARIQMINANLRLVVKIARDFEGMGLPLLDLISEGNIGLMKAVDRYDPAKGAKLSVYAGFWIRNFICRALCKGARTIRLPEHRRRGLQIVHSIYLRLQRLLGRDPTNEEIAQEAGLPADRVREMRDALQITVPLDKPLDGHDGGSLADLLADEHATPPDQALAHAGSLQQLGRFVGELDAREQIILRSRFGLDGREEDTLDVLGRELGLTRERVRQIQNNALAKLRNKLEEQEQPLRGEAN